MRFIYILCLSLNAIILVYNNIHCISYLVLIKIQSGLDDFIRIIQCDVDKIKLYK